MIQQIVDTWLDGVEADLVANYERLGLRASGKWADSLKQFSTTDGLSIRLGIEGASYTQQIENGRRPNRKQDKESIRKWVGWAGSTFIADWVKQKGIIASPYAIAHKIAIEGWSVPNKYNAGGLISDVVTKDRINDIGRSLSAYYVDSFKSDVISAFK